VRVQKNRKPRPRQHKSRRSARARRARRVAQMGVFAGREEPVITNPRSRVEVERRSDITAMGGIALAHELVQQTELADLIDEEVWLLKQHAPYWESDHILAQAYSLYSGGTCLDDLESLQNSNTIKRYLGAESLPDPTTAGDFLRRFDRGDLMALQRAIDLARVKVWASLPAEQKRFATIDLDSTIKELYGRCQEGADFAYNGKWSYHPLLASLAEFNEPLRTVNRSGNAASADGAAEVLDECLNLTMPHFVQVRARGDSKFYRQDTIEICECYQAKFAFVVETSAKRVALAESIPEGEWRPFVSKPLQRPQSGKRRRGRRRTRRAKAAERGYRTLSTIQEWVAERPYSPSWTDQSYRLVIKRKLLEEDDGQGHLFEMYVYQFVITNLSRRQMNPVQIIRFAYGRCDQENMIEQMKNGIAGMKMPTGQLLANDAFLMMAQLAWCLRSWLSLTVLPKETLRWEWKRFRHAFVYVGAKVVKVGRVIGVRFDRAHRWLQQILHAAEQLRALSFP